MVTYPVYHSAFTGRRGRLLRVGRSRACRFRGISDAISISEPYDRVEIEAGEYYEAIVIVHPLEIVGTADSNCPTIISRGPCISVSVDGAALIQNLRVVARGCKRAASASVLVVHGTPTIRGCELSAVQVVNESCPVVQYCHIKNAEHGCGLSIQDAAGGEYAHNVLAKQPEECLRIRTSGSPNIHHNTILQAVSSYALVSITGSASRSKGCVSFCDNIISGNGDTTVAECLKPTTIWTSQQLLSKDAYSSDCLVYVSWGAKVVLRGNFLCNGVHGFVFGRTALPPNHFAGNRVFTCSGWAVILGESTSLTMVDTDIQGCGGAVYVRANAKGPREGDALTPADAPLNPNDGGFWQQPTIELGEASNDVSHALSTTTTPALLGGITITKCSFQRNYCYGVCLDNSLAHMTECRFSENRTGLFIMGDCSSSVLSCNTFDDHLVAAVVVAQRGVATLRGNTITGGCTARMRNCRGKTTSRLESVVPAESTGSARRLTGSYPAGNDYVSAYGVCIVGYACVHLINNRITGNNVNMTVLEGSTLHAEANRLQHALAHHLLVVESSLAETCENVFEGSASAAVVVSHWSQATMRGDAVLTSAEEGVLVRHRGRAEVVSCRLRACEQGLCVEHGGILYAETSNITLGKTAILVSGDRSECTIVRCRVVSLRESFVQVDGPAFFSCRVTEFESCLHQAMSYTGGARATLCKCSVVDGRDGLLFAASQGSRHGDTAGSGATELVLRSCCFRNTAGTGLRVEGTARGAVEDSDFHDCGTAAIALRTNDLFEILRNRIRSCGGVGISVYGTGLVEHNTVDGWVECEQRNALAGFYVSSQSSATLRHNRSVDCRIGLWVRESACATIEHLHLTSPVESGVVVDGPASGTVLRDVVVDQSDGAGVILRNAAAVSMERCIITDSLICSLALAQCGHSQLQGCTLSSATCEVLAIPKCTLAVDAEDPSRPHINTGKLPLQCVDEEVSSATQPGALLTGCTIGGPYSRQGVVVLHGKATLEGTEVQAGGRRPSSNRVMPPGGGALKARRTRRTSRHALMPLHAKATPDSDLVLYVQTLAVGTGVVVADHASLAMQKCSVEHCPYAGLVLQARSLVAVEHCTIQQCGRGLALVGALPQNALAPVSPVHRPSRSVSTSTNCVDKAALTVCSTHLTVQHCDIAGVEYGALGMGSLHLSLVQHCRVGVVIPENATVHLSQVDVVGCEEDGLLITGTPMPQSAARGVRISECKGYGVCYVGGHGDSRKPSSWNGVNHFASSQTQVRKGLRSSMMGMPSIMTPDEARKQYLSFDQCTIVKNERGGVCSHGNLSLTNCDLEDDAVTGVLCIGSAAHCFLDHCRLTGAHQSHVTVAEDAALTMVDCTIERAATAVRVRCASVVTLLRCAFHDCGEALAIASVPLLKADSANDALGSVTSFGAGKQYTDKQHMRSDPASPQLGTFTSCHSRSAQRKSSVAVSGSTFDSLPCGAYLLDSCRLINCTHGVVSEAGGGSVGLRDTVVSTGMLHSYHLWLVGCVLQNCATLAVGLQHGCTAASLSHCTFHGGSRSVLVAPAGSTSAVCILRCQFAECGTAIDVVSGVTVEITSCDFRRLVGDGVRIRGGENVHVDSNRWEECRRTAGVHVSLEACIPQQNLPRALATEKRGVGETNLACGLRRKWEWNLSNNVFEHVGTGVTIDAQTAVPLHRRVALFLYRNTFQWCACGVRGAGPGYDQAGSEGCGLRSDEARIPVGNTVATAPDHLPCEGAESLRPSLLHNVFEHNEVGCHFHGEGETVWLYRNSFASQSHCGLLVEAGAAPVALYNIFERHGDLSGSLNRMQLSELTDKGGSCGVKVGKGGRGHYAFNVWRSCVEGVRLEDMEPASANPSVPTQLLVACNRFEGNAWGLCVVGGTSALISGNFFTDGLVCDLFTAPTCRASDEPPTTRPCKVSVCYNQFASPGIPCSISLNAASADVTLYRNLIAGDAQTGVRVGDAATGYLVENLLDDVRAAVQVDSGGVCYLWRCYIVRHVVSAVTVCAAGTCISENCAFLCYPGRSSIVTEAGSVSTWCRSAIYTARTVVGVREPAVACAGTATFALCHFLGKQHALALESSCRARVLQCGFVRTDSGISVHRHTNVHIEGCFFAHVTVAAVHLHQGSAGVMLRNTIVGAGLLEMGNHNVHVTPGPQSLPGPLPPDPPGTTVELEQYLLRCFVRLLAQKPDWVLQPIAQAEESEDELKGEVRSLTTGTLAEANPVEVAGGQLQGALGGYKPAGPQDGKESISSTSNPLAILCQTYGGPPDGEKESLGISPLFPTGPPPPLPPRQAKARAATSRGKAGAPLGRATPLDSIGVPAEVRNDFDRVAAEVHALQPHTQCLLVTNHLDHWLASRTQMASNDLPHESWLHFPKGYPHHSPKSHADAVEAGPPVDSLFPPTSACRVRPSLPAAVPLSIPLLTYSTAGRMDDSCQRGNGALSMPLSTRSSPVSSPRLRSAKMGSFVSPMRRQRSMRRPPVRAAWELGASSGVSFKGDAYGPVLADQSPVNPHILPKTSKPTRKNGAARLARPGQGKLVKKPACPPLISTRTKNVLVKLPQIKSVKPSVAINDLRRLRASATCVGAHHMPDVSGRTPEATTAAPMTELDVSEGPPTICTLSLDVPQASIATSPIHYSDPVPFNTVLSHHDECPLIPTLLGGWCQASLSASSPPKNADPADRHSPVSSTRKMHPRSGTRGTHPRGKGGQPAGKRRRVMKKKVPDGPPNVGDEGVAPLVPASLVDAVVHSSEAEECVHLSLTSFKVDGKEDLLSPDASSSGHQHGMCEGSNEVSGTHQPSAHLAHTSLLTEVKIPSTGFQAGDTVNPVDPHEAPEVLASRHTVEVALASVIPRAPAPKGTEQPQTLFTQLKDDGSSILPNGYCPNRPRATSELTSSHACTRVNSPEMSTRSPQCNQGGDVSVVADHHCVSDSSAVGASERAVGARSARDLSYVVPSLTASSTCLIASAHHDTKKSVIQGVNGRSTPPFTVTSDEGVQKTLRQELSPEDGPLLALSKLTSNQHSVSVDAGCGSTDAEAARASAANSSEDNGMVLVHSCETGDSKAPPLPRASAVDSSEDNGRVLVHSCETGDSKAPPLPLVTSHCDLLHSDISQPTVSVMHVGGNTVCCVPESSPSSQLARTDIECAMLTTGVNSVPHAHRPESPNSGTRLPALIASSVRRTFRVPAVHAPKEAEEVAMGKEMEEEEASAVVPVPKVSIDYCAVLQKIEHMLSRDHSRTLGEATCIPFSQPTLPLPSATFLASPLEDDSEGSAISSDVNEEEVTDIIAILRWLVAQRHGTSEAALAGAADILQKATHVEFYVLPPPVHTNADDSQAILYFPITPSESAAAEGVVQCVAVPLSSRGKRLFCLHVCVLSLKCVPFCHTSADKSFRCARRALKAYIKRNHPGVELTALEDMEASEPSRAACTAVPRSPPVDRPQSSVMPTASQGGFTFGELQGRLKAVLVSPIVHSRNAPPRCPLQGKVRSPGKDHGMAGRTLPSLERTGRSHTIALLPGQGFDPSRPAATTPFNQENRPIPLDMAPPMKTYFARAPMGKQTKGSV